MFKMKMSLTCSPYTKNRFIVRGDKQLYDKLLKSVTRKARWNSRIPNEEPGWVVPNEFRKEVDKLVETLKLADMEKRAKPRQQQKKYHRAVSDEDTDSQGEDGEDGEDGNILSEEIGAPVIDYYKSFAETPNVKIPSYSQEEDNESEDSESHFPKPGERLSSS
jgi:hypothetical protein